MSSNLHYVDAEQQGSVTILDRNYLVKSVEWSNPSRPLAGTATYSFGGDYEGYTMVVGYKNQKMNGKATAYSPRGVVSFEVHYVDDVLNGEVIIRDERGGVVIDGMLHNGLREGVFTSKNKTEYYYRGRQLTPRSDTKGYCLNNERGQLESVSQFTKDFSEIDGISYEYEKGKLKRECKYKRGKQVRLLREWSGTIMTEYDKQETRNYEGEYGGSLGEGFHREGEGTEYHKDGRSMLYDGQWSNGERSGEGTWYKSTNGLPTYIGTWDKDVPNGEGTLMDKYGKELYSGNWKNGYLNISGRKWVDYETGSVSWTVNEKRLKRWVERGGEKPDGYCMLFWQGICMVFGGLWEALCFVVKGIWQGVSWVCVKGWEGICIVSVAVWEVLCFVVKGIWQGVSWVCVKGWEGICKLLKWIGKHCKGFWEWGSLFILFCSSFLFGYSLSRYGWWGWSCPVFFVGLFIIVLHLCQDNDFAEDSEIRIPLMMRCLLGAISIASYHLFGPMGSSGRTGAFVTLIVLCVLSSSVWIIIMCCIWKNEEDRKDLYFCMINLLSFISLSLISSLILSPWIIIAVVVLIFADIECIIDEFLLWYTPFMELLYLSVVLTLKDIILMVILIVIMVFELIASLCHSID